ncbi:MAG: AAA family ATPase [Rubripirellula sp.]|nr:AAA family ATPase [Rubripirellula sp.]
MNAPAPFPAFPTTQRFASVGDIQPSLLRLCKSIDSFEPISAVFGQAGVGKTLLAQLLQQQYQETHRTIALLDGSITHSVDLLQYLVDSFEQEAMGRDETTLRLQLKQCLRNDSDPPRQILLIIDNAQRLTADAIEAVQSVTDIMIDDHPRIQSILLGTQKLEDMLIGSCSESLSQRISTRCYLHAMNEAETKAYIHQTIARFNADPSETITDAAISALHHSTGGTPRLINQLMTESIDLAAETDQSQIDEALIQSAWASLQQLPDPNAEKPEAHETGDIEFGELSEFGEEGSGAFEPVQTTHQAVRDAENTGTITFELEADSPSTNDFVQNANDADHEHHDNAQPMQQAALTPLLPELDYPVVIQSSDEAICDHDYTTQEANPCLESIIEEKLGVADYKAKHSPSDHPNSRNQNSNDFLEQSGEFDSHTHRAEIESLIDEELPNAYIEQSDEDFDADAERHALISLLGEGHASEIMESRLNQPVGPVIDVDAIDDLNRDTPQTNHAPRISDAPRTKPTRSESDSQKHGRRVTRQENSESVMGNEEQTLLFDPPHTQPTRTTPTADDVNAMLRRMRQARGA